MEFRGALGIPQHVCHRFTSQLAPEARTQYKQSCNFFPSSADYSTEELTTHDSSNTVVSSHRAADMARKAEVYKVASDSICMWCRDKEGL